MSTPTPSDTTNTTNDTTTDTADITTTDAVPAASQARVWVYWIAYSFSGGGGACELGFTAPITRGVELVEAGKQIARNCGERRCIVKVFTLLRVEDAGQVIG